MLTVPYFLLSGCSIIPSLSEKLCELVREGPFDAFLAAYLALKRRLNIHKLKISLW